MKAMSPMKLSSRAGGAARSLWQAGRVTLLGAALMVGPGSSQKIASAEASETLSHDEQHGDTGAQSARQRADVAQARHTDAEADTPTEFAVPIARQQRIGVTYATIEKMSLRTTIRSAGTVAYDKRRHWAYVARVEGYAKELFVFSRGELVEKGQPLLSIISPDLLATQNEFIGLVRARDDARARGDNAGLGSTERLLAAARQRLLFWSIGEGEIAQLEQSRKAQEALTLRSPFRGVVQELGVEQGHKIAVGDRLVDIADLSVVSVWAHFYQDELPLLKRGLPINITTSAYPGETFHGKITVIDPFLDSAMRTSSVRIDVENPEIKLQPDMYVDAELTADLGEGVALPVGAVLPTGKRNVIFVDKGQGRLEPRFVELGRKFGDYYEVKSGVNETERVVTSANFLIDAEAKVQGALKSW